MKNAKIHAIYIGLDRKPWCFAVHHKLQPDHDDFQLFKDSSRCNLLIHLLTLLNTVCPDLIERLRALDNEKRGESSHRTLRYFNPDQTASDKHINHRWRAFLPITIGHTEARAIAYLACEAAGVGGKSVYSLRLWSAD